MGIFDGVLLCTDLDGTLLKNDKSVSKENLEAIEYFKQNGGKFTFVTGRMPYYVVDTLNAIKPNVPFGCSNGGGVYDHVNNEYLWTMGISKEVMELVKFVDQTFTDVGIQVITFHKTYFSKENKVMEVFRKLTGLENHVCHYMDVKEDVAKIVLGADDKKIPEIKKALENHPLAEKFDFVRSERFLFEILPKGIGKGMAIKKLCELLDINPDKTIAIGDYDNDISMFEAAKVGIAVSNACEAALKKADYVTVSNEEHAVAKVIYDLEKGAYLNLK